MKDEQSASHKRIQESILAPLESAALRWLAARMPSWVTPDHLTLLGLVAMLLAGASYYLSGWNPLFLHLVNLWIIANWFGDSLDGTLARFRQKLRPRYGYYVDHIIDNFGVLFLTTGLAFSGWMSPWVALIVLVIYLLLNINIYLATSAMGVFQISFWKLGPTELRLGLIIGNLFLLFKPQVTLLGSKYMLFDVGGIVASLIMLVILLASTILNTRRLYCLERV
jgi:phosphatidylglycerophosphate synthase